MVGILTSDAVRVARELTEKWPDNPLSWDHLGYEHYFAEQYEESLASWKRKLELAPDDNRTPHWIKTVECEDIEGIEGSQLLKQPAGHTL